VGIKKLTIIMSYNLNNPHQYNNNGHNSGNYNIGGQPGGTFEAPVQISSREVAEYVSKVFGWMFVGLLLTAVSSLVAALVPQVQELLMTSKFLFLGLILVNFGIVVFISARFTRMNYATLLGSFLAYSVINGIVLSFIFSVYDFRVITTSFTVTAVTFGIMAIAGYTTKTDLTKFGRLLMMALVGIIIASLVNLFLGSETLYWIVSYVGVAVFVGLIAYDTQKVKSYAMIPDAEMRKKAGIMGALSLYLDFINLFMFILRIFGNRR